jgi:hypothetical protein
MNTLIYGGAGSCPRFSHGQRAFIFSLLHERPKRSSSTFSVALNNRGYGKINGPASTLPPPLNVPERKPDQTFPSHLLTVGKAYLAFYKHGGKAVFNNFLASRAIFRTISSKYNGSLIRAIDKGFLDRSNFQLLTRSRFDIKRLPIFALVFILCGEFTPLVVIALTDIVPYTCRIPRQIESDRTMLEKRREISFQNLEFDLPVGSVGVEELNRMQLLHISRSLGLSIMDRGWFEDCLPTSLLRRKVRKRGEYLNIDDKLILRCGGIEGMNVEETRIALVERGINISGKTEEHLKDSMRAWLHARKKATIEGLLLTR